jgi:hypothetical protein
MRFQFAENLGLRDYIADGDETTAELTGAPNELMAALEQAYDFFVVSLWAGDLDLDPVPGFLSWNAFSILLNAFRTALSGHAVAVFPPARTALEHACYAFRIAKDPALAQLWLNRHDSPDARKASRRAFSSAVVDTAEALRQINPGIGDLVQDAYDAAIDFGAHPNPMGVLQYLTFKSVDDSEFEHVNVGVLYGATSWRTKQAVVACLDFAMVIGIVLLHAQPRIDEDAARALNDLVATKERLVADTGE